jgi:hypothetical protein
MDLVSYDKLSELDALDGDWDRLRDSEPVFIPDFAQVRERLQNSIDKFRFILARQDGATIAIACFVYGATRKRFSIAERKLFTLPIKEVALYASCVLGQPDEAVIDAIFDRIISESGFDLVNVGEIAVGSTLYNSVMRRRSGFAVRRATRKESIRWLIRLPKSFDEYLSSLRSSTRKAITRDYRIFEKAKPELHVISSADGIGKFLHDGEIISRRTYQWDIGERLCDDERTREYLSRLADRGHFRGYIAYVDGTPCAFGWGELNGSGVFAFHTPGFDPQFRKLSPGTALFMWMVRDLIENTNCKVFDFGEGGDDRGYKSRFGNTSFASARLQIIPWRRPYSLLILLLDQGLNSAKNLLSAVVGDSAFAQRLRRGLRKYRDAGESAPTS